VFVYERCVYSVCLNVICVCVCVCVCDVVIFACTARVYGCADCVWGCGVWVYCVCGGSVWRVSMLSFVYGMGTTDIAFSSRNYMPWCYTFSQ